MARGLAAIVACPITVVKTQMEYTGPGAVQYRSTAQCLSSIVQQRGVRGLFRGVGPTLLSNAPFSAVYYVFYTQLQVGPGRSLGPRLNTFGVAASFVCCGQAMPMSHALDW